MEWLFSLVNKYYNNLGYSYLLPLSLQKYLLSIESKYMFSRLDKNDNYRFYWQRQMDQIENYSLRVGGMVEAQIGRVVQTPVYVPQSLQKKLLLVSKSYGLSVFNILLLIWFLFLAKYKNRNKFAIHYPYQVKNMSNPIFGCNVNSLVFSMNLDEKNLRFIT